MTDRGLALTPPIGGVFFFNAVGIASLLIRSGEGASDFELIAITAVVMLPLAFLAWEIMGILRQDQAESGKRS